MDPLKWEFDNIHKYFHGISGRRWIPKGEAVELAQCCHNMTDPWKICNMFGKTFFPLPSPLWFCTCAAIANNRCMYVRKATLHCCNGLHLDLGSFSRRNPNFITSKRLGCLLSIFRPFANFCLMLMPIFVCWIACPVAAGCGWWTKFLLGSNPQLHKLSLFDDGWRLHWKGCLPWCWPMI